MYIPILKPLYFQPGAGGESSRLMEHSCDKLTLTNSAEQIFCHILGKQKIQEGFRKTHCSYPT